MLSMTPSIQKPNPRAHRIISDDPEWTLGKILLATKGRILVCPARLPETGNRKNHLVNNKANHILSFSSLLTTIHFRNISTDSRTIRPGDLFLTLSGPNFDGTAFIDQAIQKGAAGLLINHSKSHEVTDRLKKIPFPRSLPALPVVLVEDTLQALGDLAAYHRSLMKNLKIIAITGSSGKTTVKEMAATIIAKRFNTLKSKGNFNNLVGLPLSLLQAEDRHEIAVLEMGMNQPGELTRLTEIADPDIGCIVNIQEAHLAGLNTIEGVAQAKNELFAGMKSWGKLIINNDDPRIRSLAGQHRLRKITFACTALGRRKDPVIKATHVINLGENGMTFTLHINTDKARVKTRAIGFHNISNALAAAAISYGVGLTLPEIARGLAVFVPYEKRTRIHNLASLGLKIVDDTYNANPSSMQAALGTLANLKQQKKAVAVLGDMLELGDKSIAAHQLIGKSVANLGIDYLASTGNFAGEVIKSAIAAGMNDRQARIFIDKNMIATWIQHLVDTGDLSPGDWLLIKGSRGMQMETVFENLLKAK